VLKRGAIQAVTTAKGAWQWAAMKAGSDCDGMRRKMTRGTCQQLGQ